MERRLILTRHGQTTYNAVRRMQGHINSQLSELGKQQAMDAAGKMVNAGITRILSSDLDRAADTARIIGEQLELDVEIDSRLRETNLGDWQGRAHAEIDAEDPHARALWRNNPAWAPPNGESRIEVSLRARQVVDELMVSYPQWTGNTVLIVAHGGTISALTSNLLNLGVGQYPLLSGLDNTASSVLTARPRYGADYPDVAVDAQWYLKGWNVGGEV